MTAAVYLPAVAQNLVAGMVCSAVGWTSLGMLYFGAGFFFWLALVTLVIAALLVATAVWAWRNMGLDSR